MAEYRGVSGVARTVAKEYRGVSGIARQIAKAYRGVAAIARQYFSNIYYKLAVNNLTFTTYVLKVEDGVLTISGTVDKVDESGGNNGGTIAAWIYGDMGGKTISFNYTSSGYNASYSTIELRETNNAGTHTKYHRFSETVTTPKAFSAVLQEDTTTLRLGIWFDQVGRTASLTVSNLTIGGEAVF